MSELKPGRKRTLPKQLIDGTKNRAYCWVYPPGETRRRKVALGEPDSPEALEKLARIKRDLANGKNPLSEQNGNGHTQGAERPPTPVGSGRTVGDVIAEFLSWATDHYTCEGEPTGQKQNYVEACRELIQLYRDLPADDFDMEKLELVRGEMLRPPSAEDGNRRRKRLSRKLINRRCRSIVRIFKWGGNRKLVSKDVYRDLRTIEALEPKRGHGAPETAPVEPVEWDHVERTLPFLTPTLRAMVLLGWHSGARPSEICRMRRCDLDMSGDVWVCAPWRHKTAYLGKNRRICIGPQGQDAIRAFIPLDAQAPLFTPAQSDEERRQMRAEARKTPLWASHKTARVRKRKADPKRRPGEAWTVDAFRRAIHYACDRAGLPRWSPNRLRHSLATRVRRELGLDSAAAALGHSRLDVTQVYAVLEESRAVEAAAKLG